MVILIITETIIMIDMFTQRVAVKKYISSPNTYGQGILIPKMIDR